MKDLNTFIRAIPKAELHLHIEGTLDPEFMFKLAERNKFNLPYRSIDELTKAYQFQNLQSFLDLYYQGAQVLQKEEDFYELTWRYLERCAKQNIVHTEIFFDPQTHTARGIDFAMVVNGISQALCDANQKLGISSYLIMCFLRDLSEEQAFHTLEQAMPFQDKIKAIGLDSAEKDHPPQKFQRIFEKARALGFLTVAHAGEEGPADYIWQAINLLKVKRIDHGVRCLEDKLLLQYLAEHQIPLTVCPLSNIKLCVYNELKAHPLKEILDQGLCVTINSDDPAYFGGYLEENYLACAEALNLTAKDIYQLAKNSIQATFLDIQKKNSLLKEIDRLYFSYA